MVNAECGIYFEERGIGSFSHVVQREAFSLCFQALPAGIAANVATIWILCAVLRHLSPDYFGSMPAFAVSFPGIAAGIIISILTVFLASCSPAKRAAGVSPSAALSGHANDAAPMRKAANTALFKIDTALGIHHAKTAQHTEKFRPSRNVAVQAACDHQDAGQ